MSCRGLNNIKKLEYEDLKLNWKLKSAVQNAVCCLPSSNSYAAYYWLQRHFGGLRQINPIGQLIAGFETWKRIIRHGYDPTGKTFFEVGTGRAPIVPLAFWLMGAEKTITIDLNPYMKAELVRENLLYIASHQEEIEDVFCGLLNKQRYEALLLFVDKPDFCLPEFLNFCRINYVAPGNAASTGLPPQSIDFHTSYNVFEHIPAEVLNQILEEGGRLIKETGLFVHRIDYSDHFSHSDKNISAINFLQYSDDQWHLYAGNRYMYMNRLRHDDFLRLFESSGQQIVDAELDIDDRSQAVLRDGSLMLDNRFSRKSKNILSVVASWIVSNKRG